MKSNLKKLGRLLRGIVPAIAVVLFLFLARPVAAETITNFDARITLHRDSTFDVRETIIYDFEDVSRHGIYRDIPVRYQARGGNYKVRLTNIGVTDARGIPIRFTTSSEANNLRIKIGDPNLLVSGIHTYVIRYRVARAINFFNDHDELYWNVTGDQWTVPIQESTADVQLPASLEGNTLQLACYEGVFGARESCAEQSTDAGGSNTLVREARFRGDLLPVGNCLTIVVGLPKGVLAKPSWWAEFLATLADNRILGLPLLAFVVMFWLWRKHGRDPKGAGTIIPQYDVPDNLSPAEVGAIVDERVDTYDISADIISLAVRGYFKLTRLEEKKFLSTSHDYELVQLKSEHDLASSFEQTLIRSLMEQGVEVNGQKSVKLSDVKTHFAQDFKKIKSQIFEQLVLNGYFPRNPEKVRGTFIALAIALGILGVWLGNFLGGLGVASFVATGIIIGVFGYAMPVRTKKGVTTREYLLGLKLYLSVAEKDRLEFHNAPEKTPERFEKLLPYAMVFKVEKAWAAQFEGIYQQPSWYADASGRPFAMPIFVGDLGGFRTVANSALSAQASSGGSGLGGGGFSGGGFGGGGGGSW